MDKNHDISGYQKIDEEQYNEFWVLTEVEEEENTWDYQRSLEKTKWSYLSLLFKEFEIN